MEQAVWISLAALALSTLAAFLAFAAWFLNKIEELHGRINLVKDYYFRRDDLAAHLLPLKEAVNALREDMRSLTEFLGSSE
jgi:hypothetical protein